MAALATAFTPGLRAPASPNAEYRRYHAALRRGRFEFAAAGLHAFLSHFPRHYLADNVQYLLGESYYARQLYSVALGEYEKMLEHYWRSNKLPDAMLKIGLCQLALGQHDVARASLRRVVSRFPHTRQGKLARAKLKELKRP